MWEHFRPILAKETFPYEAKRYLETISAPLLNPLFFRSISEGNIGGPFTTREMSSERSKIEEEESKVKKGSSSDSQPLTVQKPSPKKPSEETFSDGPFDSPPSSMTVPNPERPHETLSQAPMDPPLSSVTDSGRVILRT
jgi:hypothetical protein